MVVGRVLMPALRLPSPWAPVRPGPKKLSMVVVDVEMEVEVEEEEEDEDEDEDWSSSTHSIVPSCACMPLRTSNSTIRW